MPYRFDREALKNADRPVDKGTARCAILVNSCYVSWGVGARKVSNNKSDLRGHSRALAMVPFDRPHAMSY